uniref:Uncharacterized protein n=1 Tax=Thermosporothrix sp. COM3 TaxID=2490863 RepID=A0A455SLS8_9CHLR|nr:hypothetical protein KTC_30790 [Thermosporothrix sp. COM3]
MRKASQKVVDVDKREYIDIIGQDFQSWPEKTAHENGPLPGSREPFRVIDELRSMDSLHA